jgi:hypothetical protein
MPPWREKRRTGLLPPLNTRAGGWLDRGQTASPAPGGGRNHADSRLDPRRCGLVPCFPSAVDLRPLRQLEHRSPAPRLLCPPRAVRERTGPEKRSRGLRPQGRSRHRAAPPRPDRRRDRDRLPRKQGQPQRAACLRGQDGSLDPPQHPSPGDRPLPAQQARPAGHPQGHLGRVPGRGLHSAAGQAADARVLRRRATARRRRTAAGRLCGAGRRGGRAPCHAAVPQARLLRPGAAGSHLPGNLAALPRPLQPLLEGPPPPVPQDE